MKRTQGIMLSHVPSMAGAGTSFLLHGDATLSLPVLLLIWILVVGAIFGSFFNVVIYRLPLGLNLAHPPSRCPACEHPIRWRDNLPVLGWVLLRGRCRDCKSPISARYPLVEAVTGLLFAGLAWLEVLGPESSLPHRPDPFAAVVALEWGVYGYHLWLACTLLIATLIEYDGHRVPPRLLLLAFVVGLGFPLIWPGLRPEPLFLVQDRAAWVVGLTEGLAGLAAGVLLGCLAWPSTALAGHRHNGGRDPAAGFRAMAELALVGTFLGWQAVGTIAVGAGILLLLAGAFLPLGSAAARAGWSGSITPDCLALPGRMGQFGRLAAGIWPHGQPAESGLCRPDHGRSIAVGLGGSAGGRSRD
jgi:leader peptidase (prepilin peptidase)/N-methyltransferase